MSPRKDDDEQERRRDDATDPTTLAVRAAWGIGDRMTAELRAIHTKLEILEKLMTGNGSPERGVIVRLDRLEQNQVDNLEVRLNSLEQAEERRVFWTRTTLTSSVVAVVASLWSLITGR